ncbi:hypothetical protein PQX77_017098 [Marasmius sp. AFHP31]|nr:hypothetical protein PQX77_017098 [Marasmius sp. AFHP31]
MQPELDADSITTYFERTFGDLLYLYASVGSTLKVELSFCATHGVLTFGAVIEQEKGIIAYFPSTPSLEWHFKNQSHKISLSYSKEVSSRVDFKLTNTSNTQLHLHFSLCLPLKERTRLRAVYLSQHPIDAGPSTYLVDEIRFSITGHLPHTLSTTLRPVYLFVPPLQVEYINGMYCIRHPLPKSLLYWASDPNGKDIIPKESWTEYGIPELRVWVQIGWCWTSVEYKLVRDYLRHKGYGSDGKRYARDKGYFELVRGDPHDRSAVELEDSDTDEYFCSEPQLTSSSTFSLVDTSIDSEDDHGEGDSLTARLVKGFRLWMKKDADMPSRRKAKCMVMNSENPDADGWDLVKAENS